MLIIFYIHVLDKVYTYIVCITMIYLYISLYTKNFGNVYLKMLCWKSKVEHTIHDRITNMILLQYTVYLPIRN